MADTNGTQAVEQTLRVAQFELVGRLIRDNVDKDHIAADQAARASHLSTSRTGNFVINAAGADGQPGKKGADGGLPEVGQLHGCDGSSGGQGQDAQDGLDVEVSLSGTVDRLDVRVQQQGVGSPTSIVPVALSSSHIPTGDSSAGRTSGSMFSLEDEEDDSTDTAITLAGQSIVLVSGAGGKGGIGGTGGRGTNGMRGMDGKDGRKGQDGGPGQDGGAGQDGQDGQGGGSGGRGGAGGRGGKGGSGATVVVQATDAKLFMLIEADVMPGDGGSGGTPGLGGGGGPGGMGGKGGEGGKAGKGTEKRRSPKDGKPGRDGTHGSPGSVGANGPPGVHGQAGRPGSVLFKVLDTDGLVVQSAPERFNARLQSFSFRTQPNHGVFEPGQVLIVERFEISNDGLIDQPAGARLAIEDGDKVTPLPQVIELPGLPAGASMRSVTGTLEATIDERADAGRPTSTGAYHSRGHVTVATRLLGRPFPFGQHRMEFTVQYPVRIADLSFQPLCLARGERGMLAVRVDNISALDFGNSCSTYVKGEPATRSRSTDYDVSLVVRPRRPSVLQCCTGEERIIDGKLEWHIPIGRLPAQRSTQVEIQVEMQQCAELLDELTVDVLLLLRSQCIQYEHSDVRCVEDYRTDKEAADVLLFTGPNVTLVEFRWWKHIIADNFGLTIDVWDVQRQGGYSRHAASQKPLETQWHGRTQGRLLIFLCSSHSVLASLDGFQLVSHFLGNDWAKKVFLPRPTEVGSVLHALAEGDSARVGCSSALFLNASSVDVAMKLFSASQEIKLFGAPDFQSTTVSSIFQPTDPTKYKQEALATAKDLAEGLAKKDSQHRHTLVAIELPRPEDRFGALSWNFGRCFTARMPLPRDLTPMKLLVCEDAKSSLILADAEEVLVDGKHALEPCQSFFSSYSRAIVMVFWALPIARKLQVLQRYYKSPILDTLAFSKKKEATGWNLHTHVFSFPPEKVAEDGACVLTEDVLLAFTWYELHKEFTNDDVFELTALRTLVQTAASDPAQFEPVKMGVFRVLLALDKSTFWRLPTSLQTKKRALLAQELDGFEKCFFTAQAAARALVNEPYVNTEIVEAYAATWFEPTYRDRSCVDEDEDVAAATAAAGLGRKPKMAAAHYGNVKRFMQRFHRPKMLVEEQRFVAESVWHPHAPPFCSIEGASTKEDPESHKLYTAFRLRVELGADSWSLEKKFEHFGQLQQLLEQSMPEGSPPVPAVPKNRLNFFRTTKQMLSAKFVEQQLGQLQTFLQQLMGHSLAMNSLPVLRFVQKPAISLEGEAVGKDAILLASQLDVQHPGVLGFRSTRYVVLTDTQLLFYEKADTALAGTVTAGADTPLKQMRTAASPSDSLPEAALNLDDDIFTDIFSDEEDDEEELPSSVNARIATVLKDQEASAQRQEAAKTLQSALEMSEYSAEDNWPVSLTALAHLKLAATVDLVNVIRVEPAIYEGIQVDGEEALLVQELKRKWLLFPSKQPDASRNISCTWTANLARWLATLRDVCSAPALRVRTTQ